MLAPISDPMKSTKMIKVTRLLLCCCLIQLTALSQNMKPNDYQEHTKALRIKTQTGHEVIFKKGVPGDTCVQGIAVFDEHGRLTRFTDHFKCGRSLGVYDNTYDEHGKLKTSELRFLSNHFQPVPFKLTFDKEDRLVRRTVTKAIDGFWHHEVYKYDSLGQIIKVSWTDKLGRFIKGMPPSVYPGNKKKTYTSTKTEIYDDKGLLLEFRAYRKDQLWQKIMYTYEYYPPE